MRANVGVLKSRNIHYRTIRVPYETDYIRISAKKGTKIGVEFRSKKNK